MQIVYPSSYGPSIRWLAVGILIGVVMANLGLFGSVLILGGLAALAYCRGYRITMTKNDIPDDRK
jgi:hypothetical protein